MSDDAFVRVIADVAADLPAGHVAAWSAVLATAYRPDAAVETALIDSRPGYAVATHAHRLMRAWRSYAAKLPGSAVAFALSSAAEVHRREAAKRTVLAISGPSTPSVPVRLTSAVVTEIIRSARRSLLVVSFAAYGVPEVMSELAAAADRDIHIDLVLEEAAESGGTLRGPTGAAAAFASLSQRATFWHWPAQRRPSTGRSRAALHAKALVADQAVALVSSANLTDRALSSNLEVGVVIHDPHVVERLAAHFAALMDLETGPLARLT
jgi:phosphatidylserine/phosphatidylglycerophosphate/cardiolipin synthase-like enzyme